MKLQYKKVVFSMAFMMCALGMLAQPDGKLRVYVWDFGVSNESLASHGTSFTNDFESQLIKSGRYMVLERRRYDRIMAHRDMENQISDIRNISSVSKDSLKSMKAEAVFFGRLRYDDGSGEFELSISLQDLEGLKLKQDNILFKKGLINDNATRKQVVADLLKKLYAAEIKTARKEQFEFVETKLNSYRARVDEVSKRYGEIIESLLVLPNPYEYQDELSSKIEAYNEIWNDLNDNKRKYLQEFRTYWGKDLQREFADIYTKIMNDFHERFIRKLDMIVLDINKYRMDKVSSQKEKEDMKNRIIRETKQKTAEIHTELNNTIKPKINTFLDDLMDELLSD